jgi:hypothetical protein
MKPLDRMNAELRRDAAEMSQEAAEMMARAREMLLDDRERRERLRRESRRLGLRVGPARKNPRLARGDAGA